MAIKIGHLFMRRLIDPKASPILREILGAEAAVDRLRGYTRFGPKAVLDSCSLSTQKRTSAEAISLQPFRKDEKRKIEGLVFKAEHRDCGCNLASMMGAVIKDVEKCALHRKHACLPSRHGIVKITRQCRFVETFNVSGPACSCCGYA